MSGFRAAGREIFYTSDFTLVATVDPVPDYASAIGLAQRIVGLLNAAEGLRIEDVDRVLRDLRP